jgi:penicillin-binding protein 1A
MGIGFPTTDEIRSRCGDEYNRTDRCTPADNVPAIALGAKEVSPLDMAAAYATFANDGVRVEPTAVVRITDADGRELYKADPKRVRAIPPGVARGVTHTLQQVVKRGTGTRAALDRPVAGKTGTSQQWRDAWFAGYVPQLSTVIWVGNPRPIQGVGNESMVPANGYPYRIVGGTLPSAIWKAYMSVALQGIPVREFAPAPSALFRGAIRPPAPSPSPDLEELEEFDGSVPDVIGNKYLRAETELRRAGYGSQSTPACDPSGDTAEREVFSQDPPGGSSAPPGTTVRLVYQDPDCPEPD